MVCANKLDNQLLIIDWGTCRGSREVDEAAAAAAPAAAGDSAVANAAAPIPAAGEPDVVVI